MPSGDFKQGVNLDAFLLTGQLSATTETTIHAVSASTREKIATMSVCNTSASAVVVSVSLVPSGGTVGDGTHKVLAGYSLAAGDTICQDDVLAAIKGVMLPAGAVVTITAGTANVVDWTLSGSVSS